VTTYTGPLNFLDNLTSFDTTFPNPSPVRTNSKSTSDTITNIISQCQFIVLINLLCQDYVGSDSETEAKATSNLTAEMRNLSSSGRDPRTNKQVSTLTRRGRQQQSTISAQDFYFQPNSTIQAMLSVYIDFLDSHCGSVQTTHFE
jgi:hypothetical protein